MVEESNETNIGNQPDESQVEDGGSGGQPVSERPATEQPGIDESTSDPPISDGPAEAMAGYQTVTVASFTEALQNAFTGFTQAVSSMKTSDGTVADSEANVAHLEAQLKNAQSVRDDDIETRTMRVNIAKEFRDKLVRVLAGWDPV